MPPKAWSDKDERQYEKIKKSEKQRGRSEERAEEIAARTVNKRRRKEGRTGSRKTSGTGNPRTRLEDRTIDELRNRARELNIADRGDMTKSELIAAVRDRQ
jgi:plasmid stabilization system protein ParE